MRLFPSPKNRIMRGPGVSLLLVKPLPFKAKPYKCLEKQIKKSALNIVYKVQFNLFCSSDSTDPNVSKIKSFFSIYLPDRVWPNQAIS